MTKEKEVHDTLLHHNSFTIKNNSDRPIYCFVAPDANDQELSTQNVKSSAGLGTGYLPTISGEVDLTWILVKETEAESFVLPRNSAEHKVKLKFSRYKLHVGVRTNAINTDIVAAVQKVAEAGLRPLVPTWPDDFIARQASFVSRKAAEKFRNDHVDEAAFKTFIRGALEAILLKQPYNVKPAPNGADNNPLPPANIPENLELLVDEIWYAVDGIVHGGPICLDLFWKNVSVGDKDYKEVHNTTLEHIMFRNVEVQTISIAQQALDTNAAKAVATVATTAAVAAAGTGAAGIAPGAAASTGQIAARIALQAVHEINNNNNVAPQQNTAPRARMIIG